MSFFTKSGSFFSYTTRFGMVFLSLFATILLCSASFLSAADYYVDSDGGDDANAGTAPESAWRSVERVNAGKFEPGDRILFKRGGFWRKSLKLKSGTPENPILYSAYGDGPAKPTLTCSSPLNEERDWVDEGDGVWGSRPTTAIPVAGSPTITGNWAIQKKTADSVQISHRENTDNAIRLVGGESAEGTLENRVETAPFAVEKGKNYRLTYRVSATERTVPGKTLLLPTDSAPDPKQTQGAERVILTNIAAEPEEGENFLVFTAVAELSSARFILDFGKTLRPGAELTLHPYRLEEVTVDRAPVGDTDVGNIVLDDKTGRRRAAFRKWTRDELENEDDYYFDSTTDDRIHYKSKENPASRFRSIEACLRRDIVDHTGVCGAVVDGLAVTLGAAHGFGGAGAKHLTIRNCDISWIGGGDQHSTGAAGRRTRYGNGVEFWSDAADCLVEKNRIWEIYDAALTNQGEGVNVEERIVYRDNLIWNSEYSFEFWNRGPESLTRDIVFENNACYDAGFGWGHEQRPNKNGRHLMFYDHVTRTENIRIVNNIFCDAINSLIRMKPSGAEWSETKLTLDGNLYANADGREFFAWRGEDFDEADFDVWREKFGFEKNGRVGRPEKSLAEAIAE